jgi:hypothetical protein
MKSPHKYYVYYDGNKVYARMEGEKPIVAETLKTPQEAHDRVQEIVNPRGKPHAEFGPRGFLEPAFQAAISGHAEQYVKEAYGVAGKKGKKKD